MSDSVQPGRRPARGLPLRAYFALLVLVFVLTCAGAIAYVSVQSVSDQRAQALDAARFAARTAGGQLGDAVSTLRATVKNVTAAPGIERAFTNPRQCTLEFQSSGGLSGHLDILRDDGTVACSSRTGGPPADYSQASWFRRARSGNAFAAPVRDAPVGGHAAVVAAPIHGGVVAAFLALEPAGTGLEKLFGGGRADEFIVTTPDGTVVTRSIDPARWIGHSLPASDRIERRDPDGVRRLYAAAPVPGTNWTFSVGEDRHAALAVAHTLRNRQLAIIIAGLILMLAAAVAVYHRVARPVRRLGDDVRASGAQDPPEPVPVPAGPAELTALAGDVNGLIAAVGERERLEAQLRQAQRMEAIGRLAGGVAHDFNNLLTAILGHNELLLAQLPAGDPRRDEAASVKQAGERAAALTRQLLAFGRGQPGEPVVVDLNDTIRGLERMLRRLIRSNIEVVTAPAERAPFVKADRGQLEQVIVNLVVNAGDAMPDGGRLTIATATADLDEEYSGLHPAGPPKPGRYAVLEVTDTGVGMDADTLAHVFEPFFTTKGDDRGTGLGLTTVYGIVRQSGGFVWPYSEPGRGTSFKAYFPLVAAAAGEAPEPAPAEPALGPQARTVLLVEDDAAVRAVVRRMLESHGFAILEAGEGDEALALGEARAPGSLDVLVTDTIIPGPGGAELARRLRGRHPDLRTLIMSGYGEPASGERPLGPATDFIAKPFSAADLQAKLAALLA